MNADNSPLKTPARVALAAMSALFILGMLLYKERALFSDAAFRIFNVIGSGKFDVPGNRYGAFIVQVLPYVARRFHASVKVILFLFGSSYNLFYFLATACVILWYKNYKLGILMALYYFLFASASFIWVSETLQGTAWMFLFFASVINAGNKRASLFMLLVPSSLFALLAIFSHFVVIIPMAYLWIYFILAKDDYTFSKRQIIMLSFILIGIVGLKFLDTNNAYDNDHLHGVTHFNLQDIIESFSTPTVLVFFSRCLTNYWLGTLIFIAGIITLIRDKKIMLAEWTFLSAMGYIIIMGLTYKGLDANTVLFHIESEWSCIAIIVATPFVFTCLPKLKPSLAAGLLSGIFVVRLIYIILFMQPFIQLYNIKEQVVSGMKKKGITKLVLFEDPHIFHLTKLDWTYTEESIMLSAMDGYDPRLTFFFLNKDDKKTPETLKDPKTIFDVFYLTPCNSLNKEYFNVDTTQAYTIMSVGDFFK